MQFFRLFVGFALCLPALACEPTTPPCPCDPATEAPGGNNRIETDSFDFDGFIADYANTNRMEWQRPNLIIGLLGSGDLSNKVVADVGAGTGFFSKRIAPLAKKVIALDIDQTFLNLIDSTSVLELNAAERARLETRLTPPEAPNLEDGEVDAVLFVNTFMFIENQLEYLQRMKPKIRPGGRLLIVDFKRKRTPIGPRPNEARTPLWKVEDLLYEAGYKNIQAIDTELNYQYIVMADV